LKFLWSELLALLGGGGGLGWSGVASHGAARGGEQATGEGGGRGHGGAQRGREGARRGRCQEARAQPQGRARVAEAREGS
jgi:hypothetical protein